MMRWIVLALLAAGLAGCAGLGGAPADDAAMKEAPAPGGRPLEIVVTNTGVAPYTYFVRVLDEGEEVLREEEALLPGESFTQGWWMAPGHMYRVEGGNGPAPGIDTWDLGVDLSAGQCSGNERLALAWGGGVETQEHVPVPAFTISYTWECVAAGDGPAGSHS